MADSQLISSGAIYEHYIPRPEDRITVLFIGSNPQGTDSFLLARFDPVRGRIPLVFFPPQTMLDSETISQIFQSSGADETRNALSGLLGVPIDRYVSMDTSAFIAAANIIGSVQFEMREDIVISHGSTSMTLTPGIQLLDGAAVANIINSADFDDELARGAMITGLAAEIVNQRIDVVDSVLVDAIFMGVINLINTDITFMDYESRKAPARFLHRLRPNPAYPVSPFGEISPDGLNFELSEDFIYEVSDIFGD